MHKRMDASYFSAQESLPPHIERPSVRHAIWGQASTGDRSLVHAMPTGSASSHFTMDTTGTPRVVPTGKGGICIVLPMPPLLWTKDQVADRSRR